MDKNSKEYKRVRKATARWLFIFVRERENLKLDWKQTKGYYYQEAELYLDSIEGLRILADDQSLPGYIERSYSFQETAEEIQQDMLEAGFRRNIKDE
jgi:hypothetical protein